MRSALIHYIAPSAISVTPNANNSQRDLAVYLARGAKIKVYSPNAGIDTVNAMYQEWTLEGRNRRLNDPEGTTPFTIFARLHKVPKNATEEQERAAREDGYLVFAPKDFLGFDKETLKKVWVDKYSSVTADGLSVLYTENGVERRKPDNDYWYIRLGEVSLPDANGKRTVILDTGILDTDQFNREWMLNPDALPLRVELGCLVGGKDAGPTPYVEWGESALLTANLIEAWSTDANDRVHHWTITRNTGDDEVDEPWNYPYAEDDSSSSSEDGQEDFGTSGSGKDKPKWPTPDTPHLMNGNAITLAHLRAGADDFAASPSVVFTVTAWRVVNDEKVVPEKGDIWPVETLEELEEYIRLHPEEVEGEEDKDVLLVERAASATITIFANATKLRVQIDCTIDGQNMGQTPYVLFGKNLLMAARLIEGFDGDAKDLVDHWTITRYTGDEEADAAWNYPQDDSSSSQSGSSSIMEEEPTGPAYARLMEDGSITLTHQRAGTDDFARAVAAVFTVTAWAEMEIPTDNDSSDSSSSNSDSSSSDGSIYASLATGIITVFPETIERYTLALSSTIMGYNPQTKAYTPADGIQVRIRMTGQNGNISYITRALLEQARFTAAYAPVGTDIELFTAEELDGDSSDSDSSGSDSSTSDSGEETGGAWTPLLFTGGANDVAVATIPANAFAIQQPMNVRLVNGASIVIDLQSIAFVRDGEDSKEREWIYQLSNSVVPPTAPRNDNIMTEAAYEIIDSVSTVPSVGDNELVLVRHSAVIYRYTYDSTAGTHSLTDTGKVASCGTVFRVLDGDDHYHVWNGSEWEDIGLEVADDGRYYDGFVPEGWLDRAQLVAPTMRFLYACWRDFDHEAGLWGDFNGPIIWSAWGEKGIDGDGAQYVYKLFDHELTDDTTENGVTTEGERTTLIPDVPTKSDGTIDFNQDGEIIPRGESGKNAGWHDDPQAPTRDMPYCYCSAIKEIDGVWGTFGKLALWSRWSENSIRIDLDNQADIVSLDSDGKVRFQRVITTRARIYDGSSMATDSVELGDTAAEIISQLTYGSGGNAVAPVLYNGSVSQDNILSGTTIASGILVVQWTFPVGRKVTPVGKDIVLRYRSIPYSAVFSLGSTNANAIWQVMPSPSEVSFALDAANNVLTPGSQYLKCGYTKQTGSGTESVTEASTYNGQIMVQNDDTDSSDSSSSSSDEGTGMFIYYRYNNGTTWSNWTLYPDGGIQVSSGTNVKDYELCITTGQMAYDANTQTYDESNIEDREAVPVVKAAFNGKDAKDSEWAYIRTTENVPPVIYNDNDTNETDHSGKNYTFDGHMPKAKVSSGRIKGYNNTEEAANVAVECTPTPQGISETWKYEWEIKRTKGDAVNNGHRAWLPYSGTMALHKNYAEEAYTVQSNPPTVAFDCDVAGKSIDTSVKTVALSMYKGKNPVSFSVSSLNSSHCAAWTSDSGSNHTLYISTGAAWKYDSTTYYTSRPEPRTGDDVYNAAGTKVDTVASVSADSASITLNNTSGTFAKQANTSYHNLSQGGSVSLTLTSTDNVSRSLTIPVTGNRRGVPGSAGPMLYPAGRWVAQVEDEYGSMEAKVYTANGDSRPYVLYTYTDSNGVEQNEYFYLSADRSQVSGNSGKPPCDTYGAVNECWTQMTQVEVVFAKFGIMDYGKMASAVFCGDWMYSQYGKLYAVDSTHSYYGNEPEYYIVDDVSNSGNNSHWKFDVAYEYYDNNGNTISAAPFALFSPAYPQGGQPCTFAPNWAVNLKTGAMYGAKGNFVLSENGDVELHGTVYATSGEFTGTVHATSGEFTGIVHANSGEFTGTVRASLMYSGTQLINNTSYTINPNSNPANLYYAIDGQDITIHLPSAKTYHGLELRFLNIGFPDDGHFGIKIVSDYNIQNINIKNGWATGLTEALEVHIINYRVVTLVSASQRWWVVDGEVRTTPEQIIY